MSYPDTATNYRQICYFTVAPSVYNYTVAETPCCSPTSVCSRDEFAQAIPENPLLVLEDISNLPTSLRISTSLMQRQTAAAHGHSPAASRPSPRPVQQNVLQVTSDDPADNSDDGSSSSFNSMASPPELARCSRCQRTPSLDIKTGKCNMVQYGLNLYYCRRCAGIVGLNR